MSGTWTGYTDGGLSDFDIYNNTFYGFTPGSYFRIGTTNGNIRNKARNNLFIEMNPSFSDGRAGDGSGPWEPIEDINNTKNAPASVVENVSTGDFRQKNRSSTVGAHPLYPNN